MYTLIDLLPHSIYAMMNYVIIGLIFYSLLSTVKQMIVHLQLFRRIIMAERHPDFRSRKLFESPEPTPIDGLGSS